MTPSRNPGIFFSWSA